MSPRELMSGNRFFRYGEGWDCGSSCTAGRGSEQREQGWGLIFRKNELKYSPGAPAFRPKTLEVTEEPD
jgi:hypothetical protein